MKKLITATCMLLLAAAMVGTTTFAWFSMNRTVSATGMKVKAKVDASLVIANGGLPTATTSDFSCAFSDGTADALLSSTHDGTYATYSTGLKYVTNPADIDPTTGLAKSDKTLSWANAENTTGTNAKTYYKDYIVYISAVGEALSAQDLAVTLDGTTTGINQAVSIDFYALAGVTSTSTSATVMGTNGANYKGTLNYAGKKNGTDGNPVAYTTFKIENVSIGSIGTALAVLFRVYVDGGLLSSKTAAIVTNSGSTSIADVTVGVSFVASAHTSK